MIKVIGSFVRWNESYQVKVISYEIIIIII